MSTAPTARARSPRELWCALCLCVVLAGCAEPLLAPPHLAVEQHERGATVRVRSAPGLNLALVANRPWRGEQELYPGLLGLRCLPHVLPVDQATSAGVLMAGQAQGEESVVELSNDTLARLPLPAALQVVAIGEGAVGRTMALSNAMAIERKDGRLQIAPWPGTRSRWLDDAVPWFSFALLASGGLLLWRRQRPTPVWLLGAGVTAVAVMRLLTPMHSPAEAGDAPPPLFAWPAPGEELAVLERSYGPGIGELLHAIQRARQPGEVVTLVLGSEYRTGRELPALHLARLLGDTRIVRRDDASVPPGLIVVFAPQPEAAVEAAMRAGAVAHGRPPAQPVDPTTRELLGRTAWGTLWRRRTGK